MENKNRKEVQRKNRAKKKQTLHADVAKCVKITQLFGGYGRFSTDSTSVTLASVGGQQVDEGKGGRRRRNPRRLPPF